MSLRDAVLDILTGDDTLRTLLPGGIYDTPVAREGPNAKPDAFDADKGGYLKPCAVLTMETATPAGPNALQAERAFFAVYLYARHRSDIDAGLKRVKDLLDRQESIALDDGGLVYEIRHAEDSGDALEPELENVPVRFARFSAALHR